MDKMLEDDVIQEMQCILHKMINFFRSLCNDNDYLLQVTQLQQCVNALITLIREQDLSLRQLLCISHMATDKIQRLEGEENSKHCNDVNHTSKRSKVINKLLKEVELELRGQQRSIKYLTGNDVID